MKKILLLISVFFLFNAYGKAQDYITAAGLRGGVFSGVTIKQRLSEDHMLEVLLSAHKGGYNFTILAENQRIAFKNDQFHWYYGFGMHTGVWGDQMIIRPWGERPEYTSRFVLGLDAIGGLEYTFRQVPINIAIDYKPCVNLLPLGVWGEGPALSVRYTFR